MFVCGIYFILYINRSKWINGIFAVGMDLKYLNFVEYIRETLVFYMCNLVTLILYFKFNIITGHSD